MYIPEHFAVTDREEIYSFIEANTFGQLISMVEGKLCVTHMPFLLAENRSILLGHLAKGNPHAALVGEQPVLVTLQGSHHYISPSWYASPGVPTWNYQAVHIYGRCSFFDETERLKHVIDALTEHNESAFESPWLAEYPPAMLGAIVGIEIVIDELQCKYKLSQNRSVQDQLQVIEHLEQQGHSIMPQAMRKNIS